MNKNSATQNNNFFNHEGAIFMGAKRNPNNCKIGLFGIPYDGTTSFRPGSRFGPAAIREVSNSLESYCPELLLDLEDVNYADLGNLEIPFGSPEPVITLGKQATQKVLKQGLKPLILGGEHSISSGCVEATAKNYPDLILIQLDAHADLRESWLGSKNNHACSMARCLDVLPSKRLFQVGIRSGTKIEFQKMHKKQSLITQLHGQRADHLEQVLSDFKGKPIYLSIDLDWFDPSIMPGTGTPEPGGYLWQDFMSIINVLKKHLLVAVDVVELSPQLDPSNISSVLAAKAIRSLLLLLSIEN